MASVAAASDVAVRAAGGVLWRPTAAGEPEVALVHRPRYDDWSLPKGKLHRGEHPIVAAGREVLEETSVDPAVGPRLPTIFYHVQTTNGPAQKTVDYWAMRAFSGDEGFTPNDEVDALRWLSPAEADQLLSYAHDRPVLGAFAALGPVTGVVLLARHGKAGSRTEWEGDDDLRPLDPEGQAQAVHLAQVLPWFKVRWILSADKVRCVQTMEPLAAALGLPIEVDPAFSEEEHDKDPGRMARRLRELVADWDGGAVAVSSQGGAIPDTVARLAEEEGVPLDAVSSGKGSVWALSFHGSTLVAADYYPDLRS